MINIKNTNRRQLILVFCIAIGLSSCSTHQSEVDKLYINNEFDKALSFLHETWPESQKLTNDASGILLIPNITKASLGFGASYGIGKLKSKQGNSDCYNFI